MPFAWNSTVRIVFAAILSLIMLIDLILITLGTELCIKILYLDRDQKFGVYALVHEKTNWESDAEALIQQVRRLKGDFSHLSEEFTSTKNDLHEQLLL